MAATRDEEDDRDHAPSDADDRVAEPPGQPPTDDDDRDPGVQEQRQRAGTS